MNEEDIKNAFIAKEKADEIITQIYEKINTMFKCDISRPKRHDKIRLDFDKIDISGDKNNILFWPHYESDYENSSITQISISVNDFCQFTTEQFLETVNKQIKEHYYKINQKDASERENKEKWQLKELLKKYPQNV